MVVPLLRPRFGRALIRQRGAFKLKELAYMHAGRICRGRIEKWFDFLLELPIVLMQPLVAMVPSQIVAAEIARSRAKFRQNAAVAAQVDRDGT